MPQSFAALLERANFNYADSLFDDSQEGRWTKPRGDHARGKKFVLIEMTQDVFGRGEVIDNILASARSEKLANRIHFANAYELLLYAIKGWNGRHTVMALDSTLDRAVPVIECTSGRRVLGLAAPNKSNMWRSNHCFVLCVKV